MTRDGLTLTPAEDVTARESGTRPFGGTATVAAGAAHVLVDRDRR